MPRIILLLAVAIVAFILIQRVQRLPPHKRRGEMFKLALGATVVLAIVLTLAGKMHWVGAAITGLLLALRQSLPLLIKFFPLLSSLRQKTQSRAQHSTLSTSILRMTLDHESGQLSGEVLSGPFEGWRLDELNDTQLDELIEYCREHDEESLQLLEGYLEQRFNDRTGSTQGPEQDEAPDNAQNGGGMTRQEALSILGLDDENAGRDAVVDAHRKLMQKLHPDRGGSDYLAAKINQAKDFLLN